MTQAQARTNWSRTPSATQLWLGTMLCALAMFVANAASILRMLLSLLSRECHTDVKPHRPPEGKAGLIMEREEAAGRGRDLWPTTTIPPTATTIPFALRLDEATTTIFDGLPEVDDFRHGAGRRFQSAFDDDDSNLRTSATIFEVGLASGLWTDIVHA